MIGRLLSPLCIVVVIWVSLSPSSNAYAKNLVEARLIAEVESVQPGEPFWVGVHLRMKDGWHVNWINPGDAGLPPTVSWALPEGFEVGELLWPYPERFSLPELLIYGYEGDVVLLAQMTPSSHLDEGEDLALSARVDWLACAHVCVPGDALVSLSLPVRRGKPQLDARWTDMFAGTRESLPVKVSSWQFDAELSADAVVIVAKPPSGYDGTIESLTFYPITQGVFDNAAEQSLRQDQDAYRLSVTRSRISVETPERIRGVLVSSDGWLNPQQKALEIDIPVD